MMRCHTFRTPAPRSLNARPNLVPLLGRLKKQVDVFIDRMNPLASTKSPLPVPENPLDHRRPKKRQRTDVDEGKPTVPIYARPARSHVQPLKAKRTIPNAIIMLVLALGAVSHGDNPIRGALNPRKEVRQP
ncbi:hypothetical protein EJ05DRAFT_234233 [Pseudovirgaria hyperparasitica]|uniref:Uncharacterized protein n=1 Tax=Pseudovirgaria hyperparasitica TaxID=470096 RepID=A0A6A6VRZ0_9PEZI|nr:uncharacterized protein EJ05DRAFT_234233 [Pseudovirgaria hyperparasitica]KAF2752925.1 hypothetical protein EJ05DRAFT_234233 [Pseudovirgaria hyperparasitica]